MRFPGANRLLTDFGDRIQFVFPAAPVAPVTINNGAQMPSWFDLTQWPIGVEGQMDDEAGLLQSVRSVHSEIDKLVKSGVPSSNIIVAGFSQGGAIALLSTYRSDKKLLGCGVLSGWLTLREDFASKLDASNAETPCFWGHGAQDPIVLHEQKDVGVAALEAAGISVDHHSYPMQHESCAQEMGDFASWLHARIESVLS